MSYLLMPGVLQQASIPKDIITDDLIWYIDMDNPDSFPIADHSKIRRVNCLLNTDHNMIVGSFSYPFTNYEDPGAIKLHGHMDSYLQRVRSVVPNDGYTVSFWIKFLKDGTAYQTVSAMLSNDIYWIRRDSDKTFNFFQNIVSGGTTGWEPRLTASEEIPEDEWVFLTCLWESSGRQEIYFNAKRVANRTNRSGLTNTGDTHFRLSHSDSIFEGKYGMVLVYEKAISSADIRRNYNATKGRY